MLKKHKIYIAGFLIIVASFFINLPHSYGIFNNQISITPQPKHVFLKDKGPIINSNWGIMVDMSNEQDVFTARYLRQKILDKFHLSLFIEGMSPHVMKKYILFGNINNDYVRKLMIQERIEIPENINEEGYVLHSSSDKVIVVAKSSKGIFYGMQTLFQLLRLRNENLILPEGEVKDYPDIGIRTVHFSGSDPQKIKYQLEEIAKLKFNFAIIDTWDFFNLSKGNNRRIWQDIFEYAKKLQIELILELQSFGAAGSLLTHKPSAAEGIYVEDAKFKFINNAAVALESKKSPLINIIRSEDSDITITNLDKTKTYQENIDYKIIDGDLAYPYSTDVAPSEILRIPGGGIEDGEVVLASYDYVVRKCSYASWSVPYCPSSEHTYKIMDSVIKDVISTFKPKYINIGHDEIRGMNRDSRCLKRKLTNAQLLAEDVNRLYSIARKYDSDVKLLMWSDMLNPWHNGGDEDYQVQFGGLSGKTDPAIDLIPKDIIILLWNTSKENLENAPDYFKSKGFIFWVNTTEWLKVIRPKNKCAGIMVTTWKGWDKSVQEIKKTANTAW